MICIIALICKEKLCVCCDKFVNQIRLSEHSTTVEYAPAQTSFGPHTNDLTKWSKFKQDRDICTCTVTLLHLDLCLSLRSGDALTHDNKVRENTEGSKYCVLTQHLSDVVVVC